MVFLSRACAQVSLNFYTKAQIDKKVHKSSILYFDSDQTEQVGDTDQVAGRAQIPQEKSALVRVKTFEN